MSYFKPDIYYAGGAGALQLCSILMILFHSASYSVAVISPSILCRTFVFFCIRADFCAYTYHVSVLPMFSFSVSPPL